MGTTTSDLLLSSLRKYNVLFNFDLRTLFPGVEDSFEWFWEQRLWTPTQVWQGSGVLAWVTHCMNHVLYCCGHSGFDSWATIYPCPKEAFMHKCWEAVKASERSRLARAQIGLRWAIFGSLRIALYYYYYYWSVLFFTEGATNSDTETDQCFWCNKLASFVPFHTCCSSQLFCAFLLHLRIWLMVLSKVTCIQSKKKIASWVPWESNQWFLLFLEIKYEILQ